MPFTTSLAIDAKQLSKSFPNSLGNGQEDDILLFKNLNVQINKGESVAIIGASGTGKSTLLSLLACLDTPTSGSVLLSGTDLNSLKAEQKAAWRAHNISFVFQSFHLLAELTALENTQLPLDIQGRDNSKELAKQWLDAVGLGPRVSHYPSQLSGGEQQRVAIARAFVTQPSLLFADEPTGNLDPKTGEHIIKLLFQSCTQTESTLILITHDEKLAQRCDRMFKLADGQLTEETTLKAAQQETVKAKQGAA